MPPALPRAFERTQMRARRAQALDVALVPAADLLVGVVHRELASPSAAQRGKIHRRERRLDQRYLSIPLPQRAQVPVHLITPPCARRAPRAALRWASAREVNSRASRARLRLASPTREVNS